MSDTPPHDADGPDESIESDLTGTAPVTSDYKILGQFDDDDGAAVLGQNDADSGTPIGLYGAVPNNAEGYGVFTLDDAAIEGDIVATVDHTLVVGGDDTLKLESPDVDTTDSGDSYTIGGSIVGGYQGNSTNGVLGATIAGGGGEKATDANGFVEADPADNEVTDRYGTVGGGAANRAGDAQSGTTNAMYATVAGGLNNVASGGDAGNATVGGGRNNTASGRGSTVGGGVSNTATGVIATVGGGSTNLAGDFQATVAGGVLNTAYGVQSAIGGGVDNRTGKSATSKGRYAMVPGGEDNVAREDYSFAAGRKAKARAEGAFVWGDSSSNAVESTSTNEVVIQAGGGMQVWSSSDFSSAVSLPSGANSWQNGSSRTIKTDVTAVDPRSVLAGVEDLTVSRWEYESQPDVDHLGPMAEEFYDAFGLGADEEHISSVDADGVAFAAIQGLADRLDDAREELAEKDDRIDAQQAQIDDLRSENRTLRERLDHLESHLGIEDTQSTPADD